MRAVGVRAMVQSTMTGTAGTVACRPESVPKAHDHTPTPERVTPGTMQSGWHHDTTDTMRKADDRRRVSYVLSRHNVGATAGVCTMAIFARSGASFR